MVIVAMVNYSLLQRMERNLTKDEPTSG